MQHARRGLHVGGNEAIAIVGLLEFAETLQLNVKAAIKDDADWLKRFMPLAEMVCIRRSFIRKCVSRLSYLCIFFCFFFLADIRYVYKWILNKVHSAAYR